MKKTKKNSQEEKCFKKETCSCKEDGCKKEGCQKIKTKSGKKAGCQESHKEACIQDRKKGAFSETPDRREKSALARTEIQ